MSHNDLVLTGVHKSQKCVPSLREEGASGGSHEGETRWGKKINKINNPL